MLGGSKIVVFQLREIIKRTVLIAIGLGIILLIIFLFMPKNAEEEHDSVFLYNPGTYFAEIILHNNPLQVAVTVTENEIVSIVLDELNEIQATFYPLFQPTMEMLAREILHNQTLDIQRSQNTAMTEEILITAIRSALERAEAGL